MSEFKLCVWLILLLSIIAVPTKNMAQYTSETLELISIPEPSPDLLSDVQRFLSEETSDIERRDILLRLRETDNPVYVMSEITPVLDLFAYKGYYFKNVENETEYNRSVILRRQDILKNSRDLMVGLSSRTGDSDVTYFLIDLILSKPVGTDSLGVARTAIEKHPLTQIPGIDTVLQELLFSRDTDLNKRVWAGKMLLLHFGMKHADDVLSIIESQEQYGMLSTCLLRLFISPDIALPDAKKRAIRAGFDILKKNIDNLQWNTMALFVRDLEQLVGVIFPVDESIPELDENMMYSKRYTAARIDAALAWWNAHRGDYE